MRAATTSRRTFLMQTAASAAAAASAVELSSVAHAAGSDVLRVGLVGCGDRGTGAAEQALTADKDVRLVAMADAFQDRLDASHSLLKSSPVSDRIDVPNDHRFVGFDAYKHVIDNVDVVLLTTPPGFRPAHLAYAVEKGIHVFSEKPFATDGPGLRVALKACEDAKAKGTALMSGFCWRHHDPRRETMKRVRDGAIGDIVAIETTYNSGGVWDPKWTRDQVGSEMEYQLRNWYYYDWLSGDHIVEQAVHGLDTMGWALGDEPPKLAWGSGGRQVRTDPKYGNIFDHFSIVYEYESGVRGYHQCRHWRGAEQRVKDYILGAKGTCDVFGSRITGPNAWHLRNSKNTMYQTEHDELFASIRAGKPLNDGVAACRTTGMALMGRMAAYTGSVVTWDAALNSTEDLTPQPTWGDIPRRPVPRPGQSKLS